MNFQDELTKRTDEIEKGIRKFLPKEEGFAKSMAQAMNYSMLAGGETSQASSDAGNLPAVWRERKGDLAFYDRDGDDPYPLPDP